MKNTILIIAPLPPPVGGVATTAKVLLNAFKNIPYIKFITYKKNKSNILNVLLRLVLLLQIIFYSIKSKDCKILMFASSYWSFWEKVFYAWISRLFGSSIYIMMVSGDFPYFYSKISVFFKSLAKRVLCGSVIAVQSEYWKNYYQSIFGECNIKRVIGTMVDTNYFTPRQINKKNNSIVTILYVGWVIDSKGIYDLLAAVSLLKNKVQNFHLNIVGPIYEDYKILKSIIAKYNIDTQITLYGSIENRSLLRDKYMDADIFVFPSHFEGGCPPFALLEALSTGLACIITNINGIIGILDNGINGLVVEVKSPEAIYNAMYHLITDKDLRSNIGLAARELVVNNYTVDKSVQSFTELLSIT